MEKLKDRDDKKDRKFYLSVCTKDRVFHIFASTEEERTQWCDTIAAAIELTRLPSLSCAVTRKMKRGVLCATAVNAQAWIGCMEPIVHVWDTVVCFVLLLSTSSACVCVCLCVRVRSCTGV